MSAASNTPIDYIPKDGDRATTGRDVYAYFDRAWWLKTDRTTHDADDKASPENRRIEQGVIWVKQSEGCDTELMCFIARKIERAGEVVYTRPEAVPVPYRPIAKDGW